MTWIEIESRDDGPLRANLGRAEAEDLEAARRAEKELEETTHRYVGQVDVALSHKEGELLEV